MKWSNSKMPRRSSMTLLLVAGYAVIVTLTCSYYFVRDISKQLTLRNSNDYYEAHFLPNNNVIHTERRIAITNQTAASAAAIHQNNHQNDDESFVFPVAKHIVTHGHPRTATTLLFNMVATSYFLHLLRSSPTQIPRIHLQLWKREDAADKILRKKEGKKILILKTHLDLYNFKSDNTVIFTAAMNRKEAQKTKDTLREEGYNIAFVQDMESLKENGVTGLVKEYVRGYGLNKEDERDLIDYFKDWEILRQCCGQQMSSKWRNDMMPEKFKRNDLPHHPTCANYDIDQIEQSIMTSKLYNKISQYPNLQALNKPSLNDDNLNGTYCSSYNHRVRTEGLSIWGAPGGRPVRSAIDWAIKVEYNQGTDNLRPEGVKYLERIKMRELWKRTELEKKVWMKKLLKERIVKRAKSYKLNLEEVDDTLEFHFGDAAEKNSGEENGGDQDELDGEDEDDDGYSDAENGGAEDEGKPTQGKTEEDLSKEIEAKLTNTKTINETVSPKKHKKSNFNNPDLPPVSNHTIDKSHVIFLISFGEEAVASTLVERCVLSLRRRGQYSGYIIVLTDAPPERYAHVWDDNVIVMHPQKEHLLHDDGSAMHYSKKNMSLKPKRFKTFVLEYINMDSRLDEVELVYYLDIDILAGGPLDKLFQGLESQYNIVGHRPEEDVSKLYFVSPLSKEWPLQSGTMIAERGTSQYCLQLWRNEIDMMLKTGRGRDQDALHNIYQRIESGNETKCQLIRMENGDYISFPKPRNFAQLSASGAKHTNLIYISNSLFANKIDEDEQNTYIHEILQLSDEEIESGMYGKAVVRAKDTSR